MNEFTDPNMIKTSLLTHVKANMSTFQISPRYVLSAFHVPRFSFCMMGRVTGMGQKTSANTRNLVMLNWLGRAKGQGWSGSSGPVHGAMASVTVVRSPIEMLVRRVALQDSKVNMALESEGI